MVKMNIFVINDTNFGSHGLKIKFSGVRFRLMP